MIWVHSDAVPQFSHYDVPTWVHSDAVPQFSHYDVPTWVHSDAVPQFSHYDVPTWVHSDAVPQFSHYDVPTWVHSDAVPQFSHYDVPTWVHSDAVPQFSHYDVPTWVQGFEHTPLNSQSNGKAESPVKIAKRLLRQSKGPLFGPTEVEKYLYHWYIPMVEVMVGVVGVMVGVGEIVW